MFKWSAYPFARISIAWALGVVAALLFEWDGGVDWIFLATTCLTAAIFPLLKSKWSYRLNSLWGFLLLVVFFLGGAWRSIQVDESRRTDHISRFLQSASHYSGRIVDEIEETEKFYKTVVAVNAVREQNTWRAASGRVMIYIDKETRLRFGDNLLVRGAPEEVREPLNPHEFDYKTYLKYQHIHCRHFIYESSHVRVVSAMKHFSLKKYAVEARQYARSQIKSHIRHADSQGLTLALLIGVKDDLSPELKSAYSSAGAVHVLAVSGLHVGIIYGFLFFLLKGIRKTRPGRFVFVTINLIILWSYAALAGFAPSALRAVVMFSVILIGQAVGRRSNIYNSIFLSAFFILLWDPYMLMSIGFQLSYLAVLGIVYLTPKFYRWFTFSSGWLDKAWMLTSVSVAAQIATFPITVFHFNQFPVYFWLINIIVVLGAFLILTTGLLFLAFGFVKPIAAALGFGLSQIAGLMNGTVWLVQDIPGSLLYPLKLTTAQVILLYGIIVALLFLFHTRRFAYAVAAFVLAFAVFLVDAADKWMWRRQRQAVFYSVSGHTAIDVIKDGQSFLMATESLLRDRRKLEYHVLPNRIYSRAGHDFENSYSFVWETGGPATAAIAGGKKIVVIHKKLKEFTFLNKINADIVAIENNAVDDLKTVTENFSFDLLVIGASNYRYLADKLSRQAREMKAPFHALPESGAKIIEL